MGSAMEPAASFVFQTDGVEYLKLCVDVTAYFVGAPHDHAEGILDFYEQSLEVLGSAIKHYQTGTMSRPKPVKEDTFGLLPFWLKDRKAKQALMTLELDNSPSRDGTADRGFYFEAEENRIGAVRLVLPAESMAKSVSHFIELTRNLVRKLAFSSGHGGYSLNWNVIGEYAYDAKEQIAVLSQRYPGIDVPDVSGDLYVIENGIKCINWLTLLGTTYVERLGGAEKLGKVLGPDVILHPLPTGLLIQAGPRPELGDVNRRQRLPLYRKVGKALASIRAADHPDFIPTAKYDNQATEKWLARFES